MPVSGWLSDGTFLGGWPAAFYVFGVAGLVWCGMWFVLVYERPEKHPRISSAELQFIQASQSSMKNAEVW